MNGLKELLARQQPVMGAFLSEVPLPNLLRVMKAGGLDYVIVDCEHGYFDYAQLAAVANGIGLPLIVRIPGISREPIQKYLDAGADGLLAPMVETAQQARRLVQLAKYLPLGARGISTMRPHSEYNPGRLADYLEKANRHTLLLVQIETALGVANAQEIAAVEGLDALLVGPNDLAANLQTPGNFGTPQMQAALKTVAEAALAAQKPSGIISSNMGFLADCRRLGMSIFSCNSEVGLLHQAVKSMMQEFRAF